MTDADRTPLAERVAAFVDAWDRMKPKRFAHNLRALLAQPAPAPTTEAVPGRAEGERCGARHPVNDSAVPCVLPAGHQDMHASSTGCAGSVIQWACDHCGALMHTSDRCAIRPAAPAPVPDEEVAASLVITDPDVDLLDLLDEAARAMHAAAEGDFVDVRPLQREALAAWLKQRDKQAAQHTAAAVDAALVEAERAIEAVAAENARHDNNVDAQTYLAAARVVRELREGQR